MARVLPPDLLYFVLYPYSALRSLPKTLGMRTFPAARIPPRERDLHPRFLTRWRFQSRIIQRWLPLFWADVGNAKRWTSRISVDGVERLAALGVDRPII